MNKELKINKGKICEFVDIINVVISSQKLNSIKFAGC